MTDTKDMVARLEKLEERAAFQEQSIEDLNNTITDQWKLFDGLKRDIARLTDEMREVESGMDGNSRREPPPPHY